MIASLVTQALPASPGTAVLDVGAGHGENSEQLSRQGYAVTAIELNPRLVEEFRDRARELGVLLCQGDAGSLPYADSSFAGAVLIEVIEHVSEPDRILREIGRVLRPDGSLWIALPTGYTEALYSRLHPRYSVNAGHLRRYRREEIEALVRGAGFRILSVETRNLVPALSWIGHSLARSRADDSGRIHNHRWIDYLVYGGARLWRSTPVLRRLYAVASQRFGKSWYIHCDKA
jgi:2-polyprenyl-3-methyl-5-hydroxy-6-metoxy-1,4-benzoquinol methylase